MDKKRENLIEKLLKEMFYVFRNLKPDHSHEEDHKKDFGSGFGKHWGHNLGQGHRDLFIRLMAEKDGISVKEIAESLRITSGAVTQMVDGAVKMGIVTREEDSIDRRSQVIKLSEQARDGVDNFRKNMVEKVGPKFASLTDKEVAQLTQLLGKINKPEEKISKAKNGE